MLPLVRSNLPESDLENVVIIGAGGHGLAVWDACVSRGIFPMAFVDPYSSAREHAGLPVVSEISDLNYSNISIVLGIGDNLVREKVASTLALEHPRAPMPPIIHKTASVSPSATLGEGTVVMANANVGAFASTGVGVIMNTGSSLEHEGTVGDFSSLGPGVSTGGRVSVGRATTIGLNVGIGPGLFVGEEAVIGANSLVLNNIPPRVVAYGVPCVPIRNL